MDLWNTLIVGGGTLVAFIFTIVKPLMQLNTTLMEVNSTLQQLKKELEEAKSSNQQTFKRAFALIDNLISRADEVDKELLIIKKDHDKDVSELKRDIGEMEEQDD